MNVWRASPPGPVQSGHAARASGVNVRRTTGLADLNRNLALAALPLMPIWLWNSGAQLQAAARASGIDPIPGWRSLLLPGAQGMEVAAWQVGLAYFLPLLLVSLLSALLVETLFAVARGRRVEPGWYLPAWLFVLLVPAGVTLPQVVVVVVLGVAFGRLAFGGAGKYLVSPALLAAIFLYAGYPEAFSALPVNAALTNLPTQTSWALWVEGGLPALQERGMSWWSLSLGQEASTFGATSSVICLAAALYLSVRGVISWRTLVGGVIGLILVAAGLALAGPAEPALHAPWYWHASFGAFAFGLVFLAADPGCAPLTPGGRWFLGLATAVLTVLIRALDPAHPDGALYAVLLAALFVPLVDEVSARRAIARRRRRERNWS